ncbi:MAG TPA: glycosyltransferase family 39 protein [Blastocatellia bacterium]|nr:glycosyltransferase family 39 protein [Blastocatellia bacterium]
MDYTSAVVEGKYSVLGLGRALFLGYNHLLWTAVHRWFGWQPDRAYLLLRYSVIAQTGLAITGIYALCKELSASKLSAFFGALVFVVSPYFITYSGRAMSEIPGFLMLSWSLWWVLRSLRLGNLSRFLMAAFLIGLSANVREFAVFYFPFIALAAWVHRVKWSTIVVALALTGVAAAGGMMFWYLREGNLYLDAVTKWYRLSAEERRRFPVSIRNVWFLGRFAFICSATVAMLSPLAMVWLAAKQHLRLLWLFGLCGLLADLVLLANHDLPVNPRYALTGMLGLAAVSGWCLAELLKQRPVRGAIVLLGLIAMTQATWNYEAKELYSAEWNANAALRFIAKVKPLAWNSGFIVGQRSPLIHYFSSIGVQPHWRTISPGSGWPDDKLDKAIDDFFYAGRVVYVDFDPEIWQTGVRENSREAAGLDMIRRRYELEPVSDQFYRIVRKNP